MQVRDSGRISKNYNRNVQLLSNFNIRIFYRESNPVSVAINT